MKKRLLQLVHHKLVNQRVALIDMELEGLLQLINPVIKSYSDEEITDLEGSVSLPNVLVK